MEVGKVNASKVELCNCLLVVGQDSDYRYRVINIFFSFYQYLKLLRNLTQFLTEHTSKL